MTNNYFQELYNVDLSEHAQEKNGFTYVKWAVIWREVKLRYPDATYKVYESADGCLYHTDGISAWVKVGVTVCGVENIEYMPITNKKNGIAVDLKYVKSTFASDAIQRAITKACARHGIGLKFYIEEKSDPDSNDAAGADNERGVTAGQDNHELTDDEQAKLLTEMTLADIRRYKIQLRKERAAHPEAVFSDFAGIVKLFKNDQKKIDN